MGDWKPAGEAEIKHALKLVYYKLEIDGRVMYEIDPINMIQVVDGVDQLAAERSALGL
ncbi:Phage tail tube protein FII [compost metagenome]